MIGNAHLDPVWLWPWQEGYQEARATFRSALDRMDEYDDFVFTCDQIVLLSWVKESDPELFERIRERVAEGRWVNVGGWWVEPDCNMPMGESFARQGLYGQRFLITEFGRPATVGMNVDPFGHNAMIPAILQAQGMDSYTFLRPGPHEADLFDTPFWWQAPDGSRVLASRIPFEYCSPGGDISWQAEKALGQLDRSREAVMVFYGVGNHGGGPTRANIDSIHRWDRMGSFGKLIMSSPRDFFDETLAAGTDDLPVWSADLQHHAAGCYSSHSAIKTWQRRAQHAVLTAERWAIVADLIGGDVPATDRYPREDLERAWKQVLFNQFHDLLPGSAIEPGFEDARDQLGEAVAISKRITTRSHNTIARRIDIPQIDGTQPVVIFNPHPWPVSTPVRIDYGGQPTGVQVTDEDGEIVTSQEIQALSTTADRSRGGVLFATELPPLGYRVYRIRPASYESACTGHAAVSVETVADGSVSLENDDLRITIDPRTGWLSSLLDKRTGVDLAGRGPHWQVCQDPSDTWGHRVVSYAWPGEDFPVTGIRVTESGPVRAAVRVERGWGRSTMIETYLLAAGDDAIELDIVLDWREPAHLLKQRFPIAVSDPRATFEIPYASLERPVNGSEEPAQSWVDLSGTLGEQAVDQTAGLVVINNAKHGYDASPADSPVADTDPSIGITAVRSPVYAWHDPYELEPNGIYRFQAQGEQHWRCLLVPHSGNWRTVQPTRRALELGAGPRAMLESFHPGPLPSEQSFAEVITTDGTGHILATAVKGSEEPTRNDGADLIIRVSETSGRPATASIRLPVIGRSFDCELKPYQFRTFRVPADRRRRIRETNLIETDDRDRQGI
ncbi:alpha-mannosidase [Microlunatus endophyticus]|uniref:Alpha-mannosidase n=2 Tax=Microlunatus endophyticus TaxID=1716077 RepID=A0A917SHW1_9ACTN|nr:alpha-mannosidase [Microlunatus endophyticus]